MKRAIKYFAAVVAAAVMCIALVACGGSGTGTKYTFKETKVTTDAPESVASVYTTLESTYNTTYAGSVLEVKDGEIVWTFGQPKQEGTMTYTMDGDKYVLGGDFAKTFSEGLTSAMASVGSMGEIEIEYYGQNTEDGFAIILKENVTGNPVFTYLTYTFNFVAA